MKQREYHSWKVHLKFTFTRKSYEFDMFGYSKQVCWSRSGDIGVLDGGPDVACRF